METILSVMILVYLYMHEEENILMINYHFIIHLCIEQKTKWYDY